ncbi:MAG: hypothetical protein IIZ54_05320 [Selenomonadaceae bacterium]|nr:hypothetical protein [Selenomonadaceae bacterium]
MQIIRSVSFAALGLGAAFTVVYGVADPMAAFAEVRQVDVTGRYFIGEVTENFAEARERAHEDALRMAAEQVSVLVESYSESHNMELTKDEIQTIAAAILSVKDTQYSYDTDSENHITVLCHILATADSDAITADMLRERNPIRREAQIAEYEKVLKEYLTSSEYSPKHEEAYQSLIQIDTNNLIALQYAYFQAINQNDEKYLRHIEDVYATHTHDFEICGFLSYVYHMSSPPDNERALVYANRGIEEAKRRYSQAEIEKIVNSCYVDGVKFVSPEGDDILLHPVYLCYVVKCEATAALVYPDEKEIPPELVDVEIVGDRIYTHYKTDW